MPSGKITFCAVGYEIADLRAAIAKLGPQFNVTAEAHQVASDGNIF